jgi:hypothetical protein
MEEHWRDVGVMTQGVVEEHGAAAGDQEDVAMAVGGEALAR